jgi:hypothetical protein
MGSIDRGALRQPHSSEQSALIFLRQEALRRLGEEKRRRRQDADGDDDADRRDADKTGDDRRIAVADAIDAAKHVTHEPAARLAALDQHRAKRRAERERIERRNQHRN